MSITLDHILTLSGRMDDDGRFDAPRERFRRFLLDYVRDVPTLRELIDQGQHVPDQQHQRAVQDLVVLAGRFLGFNVGFNSHAAAGRCGHWESVSHLHVLVDVRSDQPMNAGTDPLLSAAALADAAPAGSRRAALCIVTPLCMARHKIVAAFGAADHGFPAAVMTLRSFLSLAESVHAGRMSHEDFVRLLESNVSLDFIVQLLDRAVELPAPERARESSAPAGRPEGAGSHAAPTRDPAGQPMYWMCTVASDHDTRPEEFLELVVARRLVFGLSTDLAEADSVRAGDGICFFLADKGVVGHAQVASASDAGRGLRDAHRFRQVLQLEGLRLHLHRPAPVDAETQLRFSTARVTPSRHTQTLVEISRESFAAFAACAIAATV